MNPAALLDAIAAAARDIREAEERRDDLIRQALAAGVPRQQIADAAGVTRARVYQIRDRRR